MQKECISVLKEGVVWDDVHLLAHKIAIDGLLEAGILKGDKDEILKARTSAAFLPHGLGHYLGMDTHDTGGNPNFGDKDKLFRYLRVRGTLPSGSVVTVEPGVSDIHGAFERVLTFFRFTSASLSSTLTSRTPCTANSLTRTFWTSTGMSVEFGKLWLWWPPSRYRSNLLTGI
jgi:Xaa-Pro aminopeptidase